MQLSLTLNCVFFCFYFRQYFSGYNGPYVYYLQLVNGGLPSTPGALPSCPWEEGESIGNAVRNSPFLKKRHKNPHVLCQTFAGPWLFQTSSCYFIIVSSLMFFLCLSYYLLLFIRRAKETPLPTLATRLGRSISRHGLMTQVPSLLCSPSLPPEALEDGIVLLFGVHVCSK